MRVSVEPPVLVKVAVEISIWEGETERLPAGTARGLEARVRDRAEEETGVEKEPVEETVVVDKAMEEEPRAGGRVREGSPSRPEGENRREGKEKDQGERLAVRAVEVEALVRVVPSDLMVQPVIAAEEAENLPGGRVRVSWSKVRPWVETETEEGVKENPLVVRAG